MNLCWKLLKEFISDLFADILTEDFPNMHLRSISNKSTFTSQDVAMQYLELMNKNVRLVGHAVISNNSSCDT